MGTCPKCDVWLSLCIETQGVMTCLEHRLWIALCAVVGVGADACYGTSRYALTLTLYEPTTLNKVVYFTNFTNSGHRKESTLTLTGSGEVK